MVESGTTDIKIHETAHSRLGYAFEFKQMLSGHPGVLSRAVELTKRAEDEYNPPNIRIGVGELTWNKEKLGFDVVKIGENALTEPISYLDWLSGRGVVLVPGELIKDEESGLEVTLLGRSNRRYGMGLFGTWIRVDKSSYYKMTLNGQSYFVKKASATISPGFEEFQNTQKVKKALGGIENMQVVEAQLGYTDGHQSWFVSKWSDIESEGFYPVDSFMAAAPNDYGKFLDHDREYWENNEKTTGFVRDLAKRLKADGIDIHDIQPNLFYNPGTDKYFLLDVTLGGQRMLGQEFRQR